MSTEWPGHLQVSMPMLTALASSRSSLSQDCSSELCRLLTLQSEWTLSGHMREQLKGDHGETKEAVFQQAEPACLAFSVCLASALL